MNTNNTNLKEFIDKIIQFNSVEDILNKYKKQSEKGFIYERIWDLCIKFGFCECFPNSLFIHKIGNSNNGKLKTLKNFDKYLTESKVNSGNSGGCSDITLYNKKDKKYIFISSKFPKTTNDINKQKSVKYYDIQNIISMIDDNKSIYKNYDIYLTVPNKKSVFKKIKKSSKSSNYITKYMNKDNILDMDDLNKCFLEFKQNIIKNKKFSSILDYNKIYGSSKENLILRFHQELITHKTSDLIEEGNKSFLWGCKCRSGKTYMIGGLILKQFNVKKKIKCFNHNSSTYRDCSTIYRRFI